MLKKKDRWYGILHFKCPRCHEGDLYTKNGYIVFTKILDMPDKCPNCKQDFYIEPGFYTAALWISYPFVLLLIIPTIFLALTQDGTFLTLWFPLIALAVAVLQIPIMRLSRSILIHITVPYDEGWNN